jgi:transcriptional regulator GlxA family with amidase domain
VLAFDGVVLGDLSTPCEVFGRVRRPDGSRPYDVRVCSARPTVASRHVGLRVPERLGFVSRAQTVVVPGIEDLQHPVPGELLAAIRSAVNRGARVASVCSGAFVLAQTGALDGLRATTHWMGADELARRHPSIAVDPNVLYVDNGQIVTSAGATAAFDLCLHLVRTDMGAAVAADVARAVVMPLERMGGQAQFIVRDVAVEQTSLGSVLMWIEAHLDRDLSLHEMARHAGMSTRTLSRRFRDQLGTTPAQWIAAARIRRARSLLETMDTSVEDVATRCGFGSATVLRQHFAALVGTTPLAYRRAFWHGARTP